MDAIDGFSAQWATQRPGLDTEPLEAWGRLKRSANLFEKVLSQALDECGLNMAEFEVLAALVRQGTPFEARPTELTRSLIITPGAVTARLTTLARRGLIARRSDDEDGRVQLVSLTAKGLHMFEPAFDRVIEACRVMLDQMEPAERACLHSSLRGLLGAVDATLKIGASEPATRPA
jgi:DNA-binding MarR family transcriptional regulator